MRTLLRAIDWAEKWGLRLVGVLVGGLVAVFAWLLGRGRFRAWRREA